MAFSLRNSTPRGSVGLDIDGDFLAAVQADGERIERAVSTDLPEGAVQHGEIADGGALAGALKDFFKRERLPRNVHLGVANEQIAVRHVELPAIEDPKERDAAVRFQAAEAIPMPLEEAIIDHRIAAETNGGDGGPQTQIVVVAARRSMVEELVTAVRRAGLRAESIDLDAFALVRTLASGPDAQGSARVYCHLAGVTNLAVAVGSTCLFTRPLRSRWNDVDVDQGGTALGDEIGLSIDYYMAQPEARPVDELLLSGPGAQRDGLAAALESRLKIRTTVAEPLGALPPVTLAAGDSPYRHTIAAGLALGGAAA